jgi:hypothetical protein
LIEIFRVHIALGVELDPSKICGHFGFCSSPMQNPPKEIKQRQKQQLASVANNGAVRFFIFQNC